MTTRSQIKTRVLILSDTHGALPGPAQTPHLPYSQPFPFADIAIHCGDLTSTGKLVEHQRALTLLKSLPAPIKVVIPGNHDLTLDRAYCADHPYLYAWSRPHNQEDVEQAAEIYTSTDAREAGIVYLVEGICSLKLLNNASLRIYVNAFTPEFCDWAFAYERTDDRFNIASVNADHGNSDLSDHTQSSATHPMPSFSTSDNEKIDIVITHGPPMGILDETIRGESVGCTHLSQAVKRCKPILHCFGHIHEGWGSARQSWSTDHTEGKLKEFQDLNTVIETKVGECAYIDATTVKRGNETIFVNASIMSVQYRPQQRPWVVDLMLPSTQQ